MENPKLTTEQRIRIVIAFIEQGLDTDDRSIEDICKEHHTYSRTVRYRVGDKTYSGWLKRKAALRKRNYLQRIADVFEDYKTRINAGEIVVMKDFCKRHKVSYSSLRKETPFDEMTAYILRANPNARVRKEKKVVKKVNKKYFQMPQREEDLFIGKYLL